MPSPAQLEVAVGKPLGHTMRTLRLESLSSESGIVSNGSSSGAPTPSSGAGASAFTGERGFESYEHVRVLGRGAHGRAVLLRSPRDGRLVAAKQLPMDGLNAEARATIEREVGILGALSHKSIVRYLGAFEGAGQLSIVMEFADAGTMADAIATQQAAPFRTGFRTRLVTRWATQLAEALVHLHSHRVLHRDMKAANVFLATLPGAASADGSRDSEAARGFEGCHVKLGDFGISRTLSTQTRLVDTVVGTPYYMSPEMVMGNHYSEPSDVWALGVILFELLALKRPFDAGNLGQLVLKISRDEIDSEAMASAPHPDALKRLVSGELLLHKEPQQRMKLDALLQALAEPCTTEVTVEHALA